MTVSIPHITHPIIYVVYNIIPCTICEAGDTSADIALAKLIFI